MHPLHGRGARHFSCLAKKSNQKKARPRSRPLRGCPALLRPAGRRPNSHDRAARATCFGQWAPEFPAALALLGVFEGRQDNPIPTPAHPLEGEGWKHRRTGACLTARHLELSVAIASPLPGRGEGQGEGRAVAVQALEDAEQRRSGRGFGGPLSEARGAAQRRSCELGPPPARASSAGQPEGPSSWARLSLVTFFGKTKKVTGPAAVERAVPHSATRKARSEKRTSEDAKAKALGSRFRGNDGALDSRFRGNDTKRGANSVAPASPC